MTIVVESSRTFLWTEYARVSCGVFNNQATDPKAWDILPDRFSNNPVAKALLQRVKDDKKSLEERMRVYYDDNALEALMESAN